MGLFNIFPRKGAGAFYGDLHLKNKNIKALNRYLNRGQKLSYFAQKGCRSDVSQKNFQFFQEKLGIPAVLVGIASAIAIELEMPERQHNFVRQFLEAPQVGADLSQVHYQMMLRFFADSHYGLTYHFPLNSDVYQKLNEVTRQLQAFDIKPIPFDRDLDVAQQIQTSSNVIDAVAIFSVQEYQWASVKGFDATVLKNAYSFLTTPLRREQEIKKRRYSSLSTVNNFLETVFLEESGASLVAGAVAAGAVHELGRAVRIRYRKGSRDFFQETAEHLLFLMKHAPVKN